MSHLPSFRSRVLRAILLGLPGIAVLPFIVPVPAGVPPAAIVANPLILLVLAAVAGAWAAPKAQLQSTLILGFGLRPRQWLTWALAGLALGVSVSLVDHATAPIWNTAQLATLREGRNGADLALGILYGGLTEELVFRWGLLSLLALGLMRLLRRTAAMWLAVMIAGVLFALAHLPAVLIGTAEITPALAARTLIWNGLLGSAFGAAFLKAGLEAAILAHVAVHIGFSLAAF
jgi:Type II CAAX prenyl endopeptidase Rce1-like